jgi:hypothetical protein
MKKYTKNNEIKPQHRIIVVVDGKQVINPSEEQILNDGWVEYIPQVAESIELPIEEQRRQAYQVEADQYLIAYQGYLLEGNIEKAEEQKALYLVKKEEIRKRFE